MKIKENKYKFGYFILPTILNYYNLYYSNKYIDFTFYFIKNLLFLQYYYKALIIL